MSIRRLYDEHKEVIARTERSKIEKRGVGRPSWVRQKCTRWRTHIDKHTDMATL